MHALRDSYTCPDKAALARIFSPLRLFVREIPRRMWIMLAFVPLALWPIIDMAMTEPATLCFIVFSTSLGVALGWGVCCQFRISRTQYDEWARIQNEALALMTERALILEGEVHKSYTAGWNACRMKLGGGSN